MTTLTLPTTDLEVIEALDFHFLPPCEYKGHSLEPAWHDGPAFYIVAVHKSCGCPSAYGSPFLCCKKGYEDTHPIECFNCGQVYNKRDIWRAVGRVS